MKINKLVEVAAGGLAVLALSVAVVFGAGVASEQPVSVSAGEQSEGSVPPIDWP